MYMLDCPSARPLSTTSNSLPSATSPPLCVVGEGGEGGGGNEVDEVTSAGRIATKQACLPVKIMARG